MCVTLREGRKVRENIQKCPCLRSHYCPKRMIESFAQGKKSIKYDAKKEGITGYNACKKCQELAHKHSWCHIPNCRTQLLSSLCRGIHNLQAKSNTCMCGQNIKMTSNLFSKHTPKGSNDQVNKRTKVSLPQRQRTPITTCQVA